MKHRFAKECAADHDAVKSAGELTAGPRFDRMGVTKLMQPRVTLDDLAIDPSVFACGAGLDHVREAMVDLNFKDFFAQKTPKHMRHVKILQRQDGTRIRGEPFDCAILHRYRKNTEPVTLQQEFRIDHDSGVKKVKTVKKVTIGTHLPSQLFNLLTNHSISFRNPQSKRHPLQCRARFLKYADEAHVGLARDGMADCGRLC